MFFLKWFTSPHLENPPPSDTGAIMDMPVLVMRKILEDVDFISMLNLGKVNRAFQYFIDETQPKFDLKGIVINVEDNRIKLELRTPEAFNDYWEEWKSSRIILTKSDGNTSIQFLPGSSHLEGPQKVNSSTIQNLEYLDEFEICLDGILKNLMGPLTLLHVEVLQPLKSPEVSKSIFGCCASTKRSKSLDGYKFQEKQINRVLHFLDRVLSSGTIQHENLSVREFQFPKVPRLVSLVKPKFSKDRAIHKILKSEMKKKVDDQCLTRYTSKGQGYSITPFLIAALWAKNGPMGI